MQHDSLLTHACRSQSLREGGWGARAERAAHVGIQSPPRVCQDRSSRGLVSGPPAPRAVAARLPHRRALVASTVTAGTSRSRGSAPASEPARGFPHRRSASAGQGLRPSSADAPRAASTNGCASVLKPGMPMLAGGWACRNPLKTTGLELK